MAGNKKDDAEKRDLIPDRLLADAVRAQAASRAAAEASACPDADLLAAYAEQVLSEDEKAHWESHFADCARCRQILAALAMSAPQPVEEIQPLAAMAAVAAPAAARAATPARKPPLNFPLRSHWRWLAPAIGVAAGVALWFALRPAPRPGQPETQMAYNKTEPPPQAQVKSQGEPQMQSQAQPAESPAPPPEKKASSVPARREDQNAAGNSPALDRIQASRKQEAANVAQPSVSAGAAATNRPEPAMALPAAPPAAPASANDTTSAAAPAAEVAPAAPQATAAASGAGTAASAQAKAAEAKTQQAGNAAGISGLYGVRALAKAAPQPVIFASPARTMLWRLGAAGRVERSADQGQTWQQQSSGVTTDLTAGAAASDKVAWIVGRAGVILRTTDGEHWQRVAAPELPPLGGLTGGRASSPLDWTGVEAPDPMHVTVICTIAGDVRRFTSDDGGRTWTSAAP